MVILFWLLDFVSSHPRIFAWLGSAMFLSGLLYYSAKHPPSRIRCELYDNDASGKEKPE